jgi:hypothetical protein
LPSNLFQIVSQRAMRDECHRAPLKVDILGFWRAIAFAPSANRDFHSDCLMKFPREEIQYDRQGMRSEPVASVWIEVRIAGFSLNQNLVRSWTTARNAMRSRRPALSNRNFCATALIRDRRQFAAGRASFVRHQDHIREAIGALNFHTVIGMVVRRAATRERKSQNAKTDL